MAVVVANVGMWRLMEMMKAPKEFCLLVFYMPLLYIALLN